MDKFIKNLRYRNLIKSSLSYLVLGLAILEGADILMQAFEMSVNIIPFMLFILGSGFPVWIIFAFVYEWTPEGFTKSKNIRQEYSLRNRTGKILNIIIISGLSVAIILLIVSRILHSYDGQNPIIKKSIAVLPFEYLGNKDDSWLSKGFPEEIITRISSLNEINVLSNFTLRGYETNGKSSKAIGRELGVSHLLTGSIRKEGQILRISCHLIQLDGEIEVWSQNYDKTLDDLINTQSEVAENISKQLKRKFNKAYTNDWYQYPTTNMTAYYTYLKAREKYFDYSSGSMKEAIGLFKQAISLDPQFGQAYAGLSRAYSQGALHLKFLPVNYSDSAQFYAKKSLQFSSTCGECWYSMASYLYKTGNYESAKNHYAQVLKIDPNNYEGLFGLAMIHYKLGQLDECVKYLLKSAEISPLDFLIHVNLARCFLQFEMMDFSELALKNASDIKPENHYVIETLAQNLIVGGKIDSAKLILERLGELDRTDPNYAFKCLKLSIYLDQEMTKEYLNMFVGTSDLNIKKYKLFPSILGHMLWEKGKIDSANYWFDFQNRVYEDNLSLFHNDPTFQYAIALNYAIKGELSFCLDWMEKATKNGHTLTPAMIKRDPRLENIIDSDRFQNLLKKEKEKINKMKEAVSVLQAKELLEADRND